MNDQIHADQIGQPTTCAHCGGQHPIEQPYAERSTAERGHLYITCRGRRYFIGVMGQPENPEATRFIWNPYKTSRTTTER